MNAPTAAKGPFPYPHRTIEQVDADAAREAWKARYRETARLNLRDWRRKPGA